MAGSYGERGGVWSDAAIARLLVAIEEPVAEDLLLDVDLVDVLVRAARPRSA